MADWQPNATQKNTVLTVGRALNQTRVGTAEFHTFQYKWNTFPRWRRQPLNQLSQKQDYSWLKKDTSSSLKELVQTNRAARSYWNTALPILTDQSPNGSLDFTNNIIDGSLLKSQFIIVIDPRISTHKTSHFKYSPHYSCVKIYQNLPDILLNLPDDDFKSQIKHSLFEKLYLNWKELIIQI
jgi:hypothetical protein